MEGETAIREAALLLGADRAAVIDVASIRFVPAFRALCEQNACGKYGKSWMCPPYIGPVETLIAAAKRYRRALVYQIVRSLADSYDFPGMMDAARESNRLGQALRTPLSTLLPPEPLYLGAGACLICERCAALDGAPCRFPALAMPSLESYGVDVTALAAQCGMPYVNGANTVTYFGAVLFDREDAIERAVQSER